MTADEYIQAAVALRKESVDRNFGGTGRNAKDLWSLSARRAWIEIIMPCVIMPALPVALRKESVDRNAICCNVLF